MSKAIVLVDHGSKNPRAHLELEAMTKYLKEKLNGASLFLSHMEIADPLLSDVLKKLAILGYTEIQILPLFIFNGKHLLNDIPEILAVFTRQYPNVKVMLMDGLGMDISFREYLIKRLK